MQDLVSILLADTQALTAAGLKALIVEKPELRLVSEVDSTTQLGPLLREHQPSLLIVDYTIDDYIGIQDLEHVKQYSPTTEILIISSTNDKEKILGVLQLGVKGYLTKECSKEEIMMAIHTVSKGEKFYCHRILDVIMEKHFAPSQEVDCEPTILTSRETEVLTLLANGKNTQQIASDLYLSPHTVHTHRKSIIKKLGIKSPTEFVTRAMDLGLLKSR